MTDIAAYRQAINRNAPQRASLSDIIVATMTAIARQMLAHAQSVAPRTGEDHAAQIECMQENMRRLRGQFSDPRNVAAHVRMLCELLRLHRVCAFARCRKALCCRGSGRCLDQIDVPEPVLRHAVFLMMTARLPWLTSGRANERVAYEAWVAAMQAFTGRVAPKPGCAHPREEFCNCKSTIL
jgi:hypothetical protein